MITLDEEVFYPDFVDFLRCLSEANVDSILVGGYAVVLHGHPRTTGDLDIWVEPTLANYAKLMKAFLAFGLPTHAIGKDEFLALEQQDVFTFGRPPVAIDILTKVKGLEFKEAFAHSEQLKMGTTVFRLLHLNDLKAAKRSAGRHKDLDDLENL